MTGPLRRFVDNFGVPPETPPSPLIPQRWRMPVFLSMVGVGIVLLALLLWLVVIPAIHAYDSNQRLQPAAQQAAPASGAVD